MKINVRIVPNSKKSEIVGEEDNLFGEKILRIKVASPPIEGKANKELIKVLSEYYNVSKNNIKILRGDKSRSKVLEINR